MQCPLFVSWGPVCFSYTGDDELGWLVGRFYLCFRREFSVVTIGVGVTSLVWNILWEKDG